MPGILPTYLTTQIAAQNAFSVPFGLISIVNNAITAATAAGKFNVTVDCSLFTIDDVMNLRVYLDSLGYNGQLARDAADKSLNITWSTFQDQETLVDQGTSPWRVSLVDEADIFARITQGYIHDTEELRIQTPTSYINGLAYIGVAPDSSATSASVWSIVKITYDSNGHRSRVQYRPNLTWDNKF